MNWHEPIIFEGGPDWGPNSFNGRGDFALFKPVDETVIYPGDCGPHKFRRTNRARVSPYFGTIHTIFEHVGPA